MSESEFYHSTMKYIIARVKAHNERLEQESKLIAYHAWLAGTYVRAAVWGKKYPKCPVRDELEELTDVNPGQELTEKERIRAQEMIFARFDQMALHHAKRKTKGGGGNGNNDRVSPN